MPKAIAVILAFAASGCGGLQSMTRPVAGPSSTPLGPAAGDQARFVPAPDLVGQEARLALTFPDGTEALIGYPSHLELAEMGVQPDVDLTWDGRWVGAIVFSRAGPVEELLDRRVTSYPAEPPIEEWRARSRPGRHQDTTGWLVFRLPSWTVHVPLDRRTDPQDVIGRVRPYQTADGFVAVDAAQPAALARGYGEAGGPQVAFGDSAGLPDFVRPDHDGLLVDVALSECQAFRPAVQVHGSYGSACLEGTVFVNGTSFTDAKESQRTLADIVEELQLLKLTPAD
jgi:hypothetical protein